MNKETKELLVRRAEKHRKADRIIQGSYWDGKRGCCVGCLAETENEPSVVLSKMTDIPKWVFYLADKLHEGLPDGEFQGWPQRFAKALPLGGVDWERKRSQWIIVICDEVLQHKQWWREHDKKDVYTTEVVGAINGVKELAEKVLAGGKVTQQEWLNAAAGADAGAAYAVAVAGDVAAAAAYAAYAVAGAGAGAGAGDVAGAGAGDVAGAGAARSAVAAYGRLSKAFVRLLEQKEMVEGKSVGSAKAGNLI